MSKDKQDLDDEYEETMSFQEKNIAVTLVSFVLILIVYLIGMGWMIGNDSFTSTNVFRLWAVVIALAIGFTILAIIGTHIFSAVIQSIKTGNDDPDIDDLEDERDELIQLKGTKASYFVYSLGVFVAMLTYVFGQPALVMFSLLILVGLIAQIVADVVRLSLYRRGF